MQRNGDDDGGSLVFEAAPSRPTPLFLGFLGALALSAALTFHEGVNLTTAGDFLLLAAVISASVLTAFAVMIVWATRAGQRAEMLAAARPGAVVVRGMRAPGLARAIRALRAEAPLLPLGLTIVADDAGFELWAGSAEQPLRIWRAPWEAVAAIRVTRITRWGRPTGGITVTSGAGDDGLELPFAVVGAGLGGMFAPAGHELVALVDAFESRRVSDLAYV